MFQPDSYFPQQQQIQDEFQQQQQLGTELLAQVPPAPQKPAEGQGVDGSLLEQLLRGEINFSVVGPNALKVDVFLKDKNEQQVEQKRDFVRRNWFLGHWKRVFYNHAKVIHVLLLFFNNAMGDGAILNCCAKQDRQFWHIQIHAHSIRFIQIENIVVLVSWYENRF